MMQVNPDALTAADASTAANQKNSPNDSHHRQQSADDDDLSDCKAHHNASLPNRFYVEN